jgi:hypothetical protein
MQPHDNSEGLGDRPHDDLRAGDADFPPIPEELEYLIEPGIHYGRKYEFDDAVQWFLENAEESDFETLAALAERARLSGDYLRLMQWMDEVDDVLDRIVDERYPYTIHISEQQRKQFLRHINPDLPERRREKALRRVAEAHDESEIADRRREMSSRLLSEANDKVHHMDIYFLFGLMDACEFKF